MPARERGRSGFQSAPTRIVISATTVLATVVLSLGVPHLRVETRLVDWLPARHPNVIAFEELTRRLDGAVRQELVWLEIDPQKAASLGVESIDEYASFLAQRELVSYLRSRVPEIRGVFGILQLLNLAGSLRPGSESGDLQVPRSSLETSLLWNAVKLSSPELVESIVSRDPQGTILYLLLDAPSAPSGPSERRQIALRLERALEDYRNDSKEYDLFNDRFLTPAGLTSGTATLDRSLRGDLIRLTPIAAAALIILLRLALGDWRALLSTLGVTAVGVVWTLGFMGWLGTPLNLISFSLVPLVVGCGIDYAILVSLDALDRRQKGLSVDETLAGLRRTSAMPILLTSLTTGAGLLVLVLCDTPGIASLGLHGALGMLSLGFLSIAVLPNLVARLRPERASRFGPIIAPVARSFAKNRTVVIIVATIATVTAGVLAYRPVVLLDVIQGNYPPDSPIARSVERMRQACGGAFPEIIIARGDLASPQAVRTLAAIEDDLAASSVLGGTYRAFGLPDLLGSHALLEGNNLLELGRLVAGGATDVRAAAPRNRSEIELAAREMHADPTWSPLASIFLDSELEIGTILLLGGDAGTDMKSVGAVWDELERILARHRNDDLELSFLGYRTMAHLFASHSQRWIYATMAACLAVVLLLAAVFLRQRRAVFIAGALMLVSGVWWLALLQLVGIHVSIFLLFPVVFAMCIGSDYGLHMLCRLQADRQTFGEDRDGLSPLEWTWSAWSTTGRAIAIAALTDGVIFLIYVGMDLVSASNVMLAAAIAVATVFCCTIFLLPALTFPKRQEKERGG